MILPDKTLFFFTSLNEDYLKKEKIEKEKNESILTAVINEEDYTPWGLSFEWCKNLVFNWDFRLSLGTREDLINIGVEDLIDWHKKYFTDENSFILIFGDVEENSVDKIINENINKEKGEDPIFYKVNYPNKEMLIHRNGIKNADSLFWF